MELKPREFARFRDPVHRAGGIVLGHPLRECRRLLRPGGYLLVGHAESLNGPDTGFACDRPSVYGKRGK